MTRVIEHAIFRVNHHLTEGKTMAKRRHRKSLAAKRAGKKCRFGFRKGSARCLKRARRRRR